MLLRRLSSPITSVRAFASFKPLRNAQSFAPRAFRLSSVSPAIGQRYPVSTMPSYTSATSVKLDETLADGTTTFSGEVDEEWSVNGSPHGGYLLSMVLNALGQLQAKAGANQPDCAHLMASYFRAARKGPITVKASVVKKGLRWSNLQASLHQKGETLVFCQALYTKFPPLPTTREPFSTSNQNLLPMTPSPYAPLTPFLTHPAECSTSTKRHDGGRRWSHNSALWFVEDCLPWNDDPKRGGSIRWAEDLALRDKMINGRPGEERRKLEWGAYLQFTKDVDNVSNASLPLFSDLMSSIPELFPDTDDSHPDEKVTPHYYPTLAISIQFHAPWPLPDVYLADPKTIGCYSHGKVIHEGRHEQYVEVWSAPGKIGEGEVQEGWREKCMLLATSTQIALSVDGTKMKTGVKLGSSASPKL